MENFRQPYLSVNFRGLIRKWHISLTTWFRDYVYIPLGGNRVSTWRLVINGIIFFAISGLWHGANWTFVVWGLILGVTIGIETLLKPFWDWIIPRLAIKTSAIGYRTIMGIWIFSIWMIAFHFFRAEDMTQAWVGFQKIWQWDLGLYLKDDLSRMGMFGFEIVLSFALIGLLILVQFIGGKLEVIRIILNQNLLVRFLFYFFSLTIIYFLGVYGEEAANFIYFQF